MRLIGRKLFCWGQNPGGDRWQEYLTEDGSTDRYVELQAGLAHTQYECIPMPPNTTWEWLEAYGALNADGDRVHGEWEDAKTEVREKLETIITDDEMDRILAETKEMARTAADGDMILSGQRLGRAGKYAPGEAGPAPDGTAFGFWKGRAGAGGLGLPDE